MSEAETNTCFPDKCAKSHTTGTIHKQFPAIHFVLENNMCLTMETITVYHTRPLSANFAVALDSARQTKLVYTPEFLCPNLLEHFPMETNMKGNKTRTTLKFYCAVRSYFEKSGTNANEHSFVFLGRTKSN